MRCIKIFLAFDATAVETFFTSDRFSRRYCTIFEQFYYSQLMFWIFRLSSLSWQYGAHRCYVDHVGLSNDWLDVEDWTNSVEAFAVTQGHKRWNAIRACKNSAERYIVGDTIWCHFQRYRCICEKIQCSQCFHFFLGNDNNGIVTVFILVLVANVAVTARPRYFYLRLSQSCSLIVYGARGTQSKIVLHVLCLSRVTFQNLSSSKLLLSHGFIPLSKTKDRSTSHLHQRVCARQALWKHAAFSASYSPWIWNELEQ